MENLVYFFIGSLAVAICTMGAAFAVSYCLTWGDTEKSIAFADVSTRLVSFCLIFSLLTGGL
jgi:hypothetical protein